MMIPSPFDGAKYSKGIGISRHLTAQLQRRRIPLSLEQWNALPLAEQEKMIEANPVTNAGVVRKPSSRAGRATRTAPDYSGSSSFAKSGIAQTGMALTQLLADPRELTAWVEQEKSSLSERIKILNASCVMLTSVGVPTNTFTLTESQHTRTAGA